MTKTSRFIRSNEIEWHFVEPLFYNQSSKLFRQCHAFQLISPPTIVWYRCFFFRFIHCVCLHNFFLIIFPRKKKWKQFDIYVLFNMQMILLLIQLWTNKKNRFWRRPTSMVSYGNYRSTEWHSDSEFVITATDIHCKRFGFGTFAQNSCDGCQCERF